ncbi:MAG: LapA family protein [Actinomycetota bacterium]|nr:LapA family protein [Actinomycetota bacterium]
MTELHNTVPSSPPPAPGPGRGSRERRDVLRAVVALVLLAALVAFVLKNSEAVAVSFVLFDAHVRLIWVLLVTAIVGGVLDRLVLWWSRHRSGLGGDASGARRHRSSRHLGG